LKKFIVKVSLKFTPSRIILFIMLFWSIYNDFYIRTKGRLLASLSYLGRSILCPLRMENTLFILFNDQFRFIWSWPLRSLRPWYKFSKSLLTFRTINHKLITKKSVIKLLIISFKLMIQRSVKRKNRECATKMWKIIRLMSIRSLFVGRFKHRLFRWWWRALHFYLEL